MASRTYSAKAALSLRSVTMYKCCTVNHLHSRQEDYLPTHCLDLSASDRELIPVYQPLHYSRYQPR
jgi:hypothetical protein